MTTLRLRDVAQVLTSNVDKVIAPEEHQVRLCNYVDVYKNNFIESNMRFNPGSATTAEMKKFNLIPGDVIITKDSETRDDIGVPAFVRSSSDDLVCGYHLSILRANPSRMVGAFLYWHLLSKRTQEDFANIANGVTRFGLTLGGIKSIPIHVPDLATQRRIADFLDCETARIDLLIEKKQRLVEVLGEKRQELISKAVTKGMNAETAMKHTGITWLGEVPKHWKVKPIKYLVSRPLTDGPHVTPIKHEDGVPFISAEAISGGSVNFAKKWGYISVEDHRLYSNSYKPQRNDVFVVKLGATTGKVARVETDIEFNIWVPLAAIRPKTPNLSKFIYYALQSSQVKDAYQILWTYGTQQTLGLGTLSNLRLPIPPDDEIEVITDYIEEKLPKIDRISTTALGSITRLKEYRSALITAAVTGQIDVGAYARTGSTDHRVDTFEQEANA